MTQKALPATALRWSCPADSFTFDTTAEVEPVAGVVGQDSAVEALRFGLECDAPGQNVFVRGLTGTGRMTLVRQLLEELHPVCPPRTAYCYVHNFSERDRPRLITIPASQAKSFKRRVRAFAEFVREDLSNALNEAPLKAERQSIESLRQEEIEEITGAFQKELQEAGLELVTVQRGPIAMPVILPVVDGKAVAPEELERLHKEGKVSDEEHAAFRDKRRSFQERLSEVSAKAREIQQGGLDAIREKTEKAAREILDAIVQPILAEYGSDDVRRFFTEAINDVVENRLFGSQEGEFDPVHLYGVNVLLEHEDTDGCPIVVENTPTLAKLLGTVEREWGPQGPLPADYRSIRAGSLLRANGGYLILDARDVLSEIGAWKVLVRTLRTGDLEMVPPEISWVFWTPSLKPEPIPVKLRVILVGDAWIYHLLDLYDADFSHLFKVLADFDSLIERRSGAQQYAGVLARIAREENLLPFHRTAVAALVEQGARIGAFHGKLTARFGRVADIAREAAFLAKKAGQEAVEAPHVVEAVRRTKERGRLPSLRFRELVRDDVIHVQTEGSVVGQINGLAVIQAGPVSYGFPARITASVGAGSAGVVNIEGQSALSGSIHTKGFHILGGLLRHLLRSEHSLAFSASLAFEQSYGMIDGDSASGAEICCLLSALTGVPIRQSLAMTGSIDQLGRIQAIGGVNEKIEGFYDTCKDSDTLGEQGVVIPQANVGDLMLRRDVVEACAAGRFHVYAVETVRQALEVLTGMPAGEPGEDGGYPDGTLLAIARAKAREYWQKSLPKPPDGNGPAEATD